MVKEIFLKLMFNIVNSYMNFIMILPFLSERMKMKKFEKLVANLRDKTEYAAHIRNLKQVLNHGLALKRVHRVIKFNENTWLKPYINMNTNLRKKAKNDLKKYSF